MARITRQWYDHDFFGLARSADDAHRDSLTGSVPSGELATAAIMAILDCYASPSDCRDMARKFGCDHDTRSLAYAVRDEAAESGQPPSMILVDLLYLQVS